ncbi:hypothetical protein [Nocardia sp. NPDC056000]|uniref:hypothetical protein n=1 Tax=Nocardia sp. NPDC056000 TaxID=3345674 RepID=UPI0035E34AA8
MTCDLTISDVDENRIELARGTAAQAFIMGRNMFGPVRGEWDRQWNGWWGDNPPYHGSVFVLTHHPRDPQPMRGCPRMPCGARFRGTTGWADDLRAEAISAGPNALNCRTRTKG